MFERFQANKRIKVLNSFIVSKNQDNISILLIISA